MTSDGSGGLTAADRTEIADLYARYALAIDFGDGSDWEECSTRTSSSASPGRWLLRSRVVTHERLRP